MNVQPKTYTRVFIAELTTHNSKKLVKKNELGVPLWCSGLRIQHCHFSGLCGFCGMGSIPGPGTSKCHEHGQKKKKKKKKKCHFDVHMDTEVIILSDISQTEKDKYYMISLICGILKIVQMNLFMKQKHAQT